MVLPYKNKRQLIQILAIISASFSSIGSGMQYAWTSPTIPKLVADESANITLEQASYLLIFQGVSMALSAPLFAVMIDKLGRKSVGLFLAVPQIIGWVMIAFVTNIWLLYLAKFIVGISEAAYYASIPIYVCEITDPDIRHGWTALISVSLYLGIFLINVIGAEMTVSTTALICMGFSFFHLLIFSWVPESPYYLLMKNQTGKARKAFQVLQKEEDVEKKLSILTNDINRQISEKGTLKELFFIHSNRKALLIVIGVRGIQQLSGLSAYEVYSQYMFKEAGVDLSPTTSSIIFSGMLVLGPALGSFVVNKFGRKSLLIFSSLGCGLSLSFEAIYFALIDFTSINVLQFYWFPIFGMTLYVAFCSIGLATIPSIIAGEMFSASIKSQSTIVINIFMGIWLIVTPKLFQSLTETFGMYSPFCFFALCSFLGIVFVYFCVIETKGKTLEEIQQELKQD